MSAACEKTRKTDTPIIQKIIEANPVRNSTGSDLIENKYNIIIEEGKKSINILKQHGLTKLRAPRWLDFD